MNSDQEFQDGVDALKKNNLNNAKKIFKDLLKKYPKHAETNHLMGITLQLLNKVDEALIYYQKTVKIKPDFAEAHKNLGNMFYRLGEIYKAENSYNASLKINPKLDEAKINLEVISGQKKVDHWISQNIKTFKETRKKNELNPFITQRNVETGLLDQLYKIHTIELSQTKDLRFGNGKCSSDMKLFENILDQF